ncbi:stress response membrane protein YncL [Escherichia coli]|nr:stress response membrane protein YncL [Escherichia coli]
MYVAEYSVLINVFAAVGLFTLISMRFGWFI